MNRRSLSLCALLLATLAACAETAPSAGTTDTTAAKVAPKETERARTGPKPKLGSFGVDTDGMDLSVKPGDDFYKYAGGKWLAQAKIPADKTRWGAFDALGEKSRVDVHTILDEVAKGQHPKGSVAQKVADFYAAYLDTDAIEKKGMKPAQADLKAIQKLKTSKDVARLIATPGIPLAGPIGIGMTIDAKDPNQYVLAAGAGGLSLPDRDFYLKDDARFKEIRAKYEAHIAKVLAFGHDKKKNAARDASDAKAILALETKIAEHHWDRVKRRDAEKRYNPKTISALEKEIPKFPWRLYADTAGFKGQDRVIVGELDAMPALAELFASTPVSTWKAYLTYHYLVASSSILPKALDQEVFEFFGKTVGGTPQQAERWKRATGATGGVLGEAVGQLYVEKHFQPRAKEQMKELVENIRKAYAARIEANDWMTAPTKKAALEKLAAFRPKIGYPDKWKDYSALDVQPGDAWGNRRRASLWSHDRALEKFGKPTDKDEWGMTPQTVNAYYNPLYNEIVFPAAILQAPFFDPDADPAVNYGGIGAVIGHEMGHGFDDQGAKYDAKGVLRNWWAEADLATFKKRTDALSDQYSQYEPLPGVKVNGKLTLGENIGDLGGSNVALEAYKISQQGKERYTVDGFNNEQRFFLGYAQVWRALSRDEALKNQVMTDPHSPPMYRTNGIVRNLDAWYTAFDVKPGDKLFIAPQQRVKIW
ncbi:MAG: M13 family metallopeptidase [Labilithrix sp.]|nr:M13 family metallopeptidase [Labilithrix sp.]MCW5816997.1 M13 family metallopeptidase [Labilithrix sp.]